MPTLAHSLPVVRPIVKLRPLAERLTAIIDIGSNSVRLVVYRGAVRVPPVIFNEKVMCGLGRGLGASSDMDRTAMDLAIETLRRFALLAQDMAVDHLAVLATAAVRSARNGADFVAEATKATGLQIRVITGEEEGSLSGYGVLSAIPDADGVVGDLGGGSLELVRICQGQVGDRVSLPIGALTLLDQKDVSPRKLKGQIQDILKEVPWLDKAKGKPFYTVGGSWRALAHLDMHLQGYPLPIVHAYSMDADAPARLLAKLKTLDKKDIKAIPNVTERRLPSLPIAALVLEEVVDRLHSPAIISSAYGLREGLLYSTLPERFKAEDPLLAACRMEAELEGRFPEHANALMHWMDPVFRANEAETDQRLRCAACLLADVAWRGHPDFRAERALDASLFGNWVGIDARGRAMIGTALYVCYGANIEGRVGAIVRPLLSRNDLDAAIAWGLALRLGQRLTGGTARPLSDSTLRRSDGRLVLSLEAKHSGLYGEVVARRLKSLADHLGLIPQTDVKAQAA